MGRDARPSNPPFRHSSQRRPRPGARRAAGRGPLASRDSRLIERGQNLTKAGFLGAPGRDVKYERAALSSRADCAVFPGGGPAAELEVCGHSLPEIFLSRLRRISFFKSVPIEARRSFWNHPFLSAAALRNGGSRDLGVGKGQDWFMGTSLSSVSVLRINLAFKPSFLAPSAANWPRPRACNRLPQAASRT